MKALSSSKIIDTLGGTSAVAKLLGVKPPSVSGWREGGIPQDKLFRLAPQIEAKTDRKVMRWHLCPDQWHLIWPELIGAKGAPPVPREQSTPTEAGGA